MPAIDAQALLSCPTASIHTEKPAKDILQVQNMFPLPIDTHLLPVWLALLIPDFTQFISIKLILSCYICHPSCTAQIFPGCLSLWLSFWRLVWSNFLSYNPSRWKHTSRQVDSNALTKLFISLVPILPWPDKQLIKFQSDTLIVFLLTSIQFHKLVAFFTNWRSSLASLLVQLTCGYQ